MNINILKSKIHRATVTNADLHYEGSIAICPELIKASGLREFEQVDIYNINNGERLTTYVIKGEEGQIGIQGAAAHKASVGDLVIICSYCQIEAEESFEPIKILVDKNNKVAKNF